MVNYKDIPAGKFRRFGQSGNLFNILHKELINNIMEEVRLSKNFKNSEIKYIDSNGDIHLKDGVHRLQYNTHIDPYQLESHLNEIDLKVQKRRLKEKELYTKEDGITEY
jgi:hypothetical protein